MEASNFSDNTIKSYLTAFKRLHAFYNLPVEQLTDHQLVAFICHIKEGLHLSPESMRVAVCAIKYFYRHILGKTALAKKIPYPKQEKKIRTILSGAETRSLFEKTANIKHRLFLKLTYSSGLRRSEVIDIQLADFDWKNMQLIIRQGKGKKDRYTVLAHSLKPDFDQYVLKYTPEQFLFYGHKKKKTGPLAKTPPVGSWTRPLKGHTLQKKGCACIPFAIPLPRTCWPFTPTW